ncbi:MAG: 3-dehydroquinate synthase [Archangiaceae bacterium]|nr:3-dehydroquinate synthase [Archangiaceae bacterium]
MTTLPPGALTPSVDRTGRFVDLVKSLPDETVVFADARVLRLHRDVAKSLSKRTVIPLTAGEGLKSLATIERVAKRLSGVSRSATFVALGGGTVGDVVTVIAHLHKRGVKLVHAPTTLLAAVDSSIGGKGAVNVGDVKNALGVFHGPVETWLCPKFFDTLSEAQRREGRLEAWKMVVTLDAATARRWMKKTPNDLALLREARDLKEAVVRTDPYETKGVRVVLNFGHTFGHVLESVSGFSLRHGEAVGLGMLCALDVGVDLGLTPRGVAEAIEAALPNAKNARAVLAKLAKVPVSKVAKVLAADKKGSASQLRMVLLEDLGRWRTVGVDAKTWQSRWTGSWRA